MHLPKAGTWQFFHTSNQTLYIFVHQTWHLHPHPWTYTFCTRSPRKQEHDHSHFTSWEKKNVNTPWEKQHLKTSDGLLVLLHRTSISFSRLSTMIRSPESRARGQRWLGVVIRGVALSRAGSPQRNCTSSVSHAGAGGEIGASTPTGQEGELRGFS